MDGQFIVTGRGRRRKTREEGVRSQKSGVSRKGRTAGERPLSGIGLADSGATHFSS